MLSVVMLIVAFLIVMLIVIIMSFVTLSAIIMSFVMLNAVMRSVAVPCIHLSAHLSVYHICVFSTCLSVNLSVHQSFHMSVFHCGASIRPSLPFVFLSVHLSV